MMTIRLDEVEKELLQEYAEEHDMTISQIIRSLIKKFLDENIDKPQVNIPKRSLTIPVGVLNITSNTNANYKCQIKKLKLFIHSESMLHYSRKVSHTLRK